MDETVGGGQRAAGADGQAAPRVPALTYATPATDVPEWDDGAEKRLDKGKGPQSIRKFFKTAYITVRYYAQSMERRYLAKPIAGPCAVCLTRPATKVATLRWSATLAPQATLRMTIDARQVSQVYSTSHSICADCLELWKRRMFSLRWAFIIARQLPWLWIGWIVINGMAALYNEIFGARVLTNWQSRVFFLLYPAILLPHVLHLAWRWRLPRFLRKLFPRGVRLTHLY